MRGVEGSEAKLQEEKQDICLQRYMQALSRCLFSK